MVQMHFHFQIKVIFSFQRLAFGEGFLLDQKNGRNEQPESLV